MRQGEKATIFYILISGKAKVTAPNEDGEEEAVAVILPGGLTNYFGEMYVVLFPSPAE